MATRHVGRIATATASMAMLLVTAACGSSSSTGTSTTSSPAGGGAATSASGAAPSAGGGQSFAGKNLSILYGASGQAETDALKEATDAWSKTSGAAVTLTAATDLPQQLAQGFSSGDSADLFYTDASKVGGFAKAGNLFAYGDSLPNKADFYPSLVDTFSVGGKLQCAPKDFSTLALFINTDDWTAAGLTDADVPKTWDQLAAVAKKLTTDGRIGLSVGPTRDRVDAFFVQNGGYLTDADQKTATVNSESNIAALTYFKTLLADGSMKFPGDLSAGWAGEAFGKNFAAMTIEGNWLLGALSKDYPGIKFTAVELPAGPTGTKGTLSFTNCWGIAASSKNQDAAVNLVEFLTTPEQQLKFAAAFGVLPSVKTAEADYLKANPKNTAFINGVAYAKGVLTVSDTAKVMTDFDAQLQSLANNDPKTILDSVQQSLQDALGG